MLIDFPESCTKTPNTLSCQISLYLRYRRMQRSDWCGLITTDFTISHGQKETSCNQEAINLSALYSNSTLRNTNLFVFYIGGRQKLFQRYKKCQKHLGKNVGHIDQYQGLQPHSDEYKTLEKSWLSYVCHERKNAGMHESSPVASHSKRRTGASAKPTNTFKPTHRFLPCSCGKSGMSYPHWPPSCHEEAVDQLRCLLEANPHRLHLTHEWRNFLWREVAGRIGSTGVGTGRGIFDTNISTAG